MKFFKLLLFILLFLHTHLYAKDGSLEKVTLQLQWKHQFEFAGFYAAKEKGFYKDVGLDVSFVEFNENTNISDEVLNGKAQYGLSYSSLIVDYFNNKPLVLLANFFKQSPLVLIAQEDIKSPAGLKGKRVMGLSNGIHNITLLTMLNKFGIHSTDIVNVPASFSIDDFVNKKIDAMSVFTTNELYLLNQKGIKYTIFDPVVYGSKYYDANLFTTQKELLEHPQRAKNFTEASIRGWEYALEHPEEIIELILQKYNSQNKSREALRFEEKQITSIMLPNVYKVGSIDIDRIQMITDNFIQAGFIENIHNKKIEDFIYNHSKSAQKLQLSLQERKYLLEKKSITLCVDPDWMPFEKIENGKHMGLSSDYLHHVESDIGIPITLIPTDSWKESIDNIKNKKCDIISLVMQTPERKKYMHITKPFLSIPLVIATSNDKFFISDFKALRGRSIGIGKNYAQTELLKIKYPLINFVELGSITEGLQHVEEGKIFGYIDNLTTISYQIQNNFPTKLKIAGQFDEILALGIGVHNDEPILLDILNKSLDTLDSRTKERILNQWISVKYELGFDYTLFWYILTPFLLLALMLLVSHYILRQYNIKLKQEVDHKVEELRQKDEILIQKQRMAAMGEMLSMIAHQWRQPLGAINFALMGIEVKLASGYFNLATKDGREKFLNYLERKHKSINEYVEHLSTTTDDFRNFFNPNKNKESVSLTTPIENALSIVQTHLEKHGIKLIKEYQTDATLSLYRNEVIQVILTLLKNAEDNFSIKKTVDPKITIQTKKVKNDLIIILGDNGGGIPKEISKRIFEPYFSTKDEKNGTGLGLYMSKIIIEDHHNGILNIKNRDGGVFFEIIFRT